MNDARVVANEVLKTAWRLGHDLTQIDIQKLCYFMHGHHLLEHGEPLIATEFEAWTFGPVQPVLYSSFKRYESNPITELATAFDPIRRVPKQLGELTSNSARHTIDTYLPRYLGLPSFALVEITHAEGTPWSETVRRAKTSANLGMKISTDLVRERFEGLSTP